VRIGLVCLDFLLWPVSFVFCFVFFVFCFSTSTFYILYFIFYILYFVIGPPDTGKSRACEQWLSCCAKALQMQSDGGSGKAYTADDKTRDLRCCFEDELKDLLSSDGNDATSSQTIKAKQTLLSNGILTYERLIQHPSNNGEYILQKIRKND